MGLDIDAIVEGNEVVKDMIPVLLAAFGTRTLHLRDNVYSSEE